MPLRLPRHPAAALVLAAALAAAGPARAHVTPSDLSAVSLLPVAVSVAAPSMLLAGGVSLTVVAVEAAAAGTVWVLERASDGARFSLQLAGGAVVAVGTGLAVVAVSTGWILSEAGRAICFVPNEIGASLRYNEQVTR